MKPGSLLQSKVPNPASKSKDEERLILTARSFRPGGFLPSKTKGSIKNGKTTVYL